MRLMILLLILVPAPRSEPPFPVGQWDCDWGAVRQDMVFYPDGSYYSEKYGGGFWGSDADGNVWFSEQNDTTHWVMWIDSKTGGGTGWHRNLSDGSFGGEVKVRLKRK